MRTKVCDMLGCELPIFAFSHCRDVVVEVTKAGGFGVLGAVTFSPEQLEMELKWIDEHVDGRPYGVDVLIPENYETEAADPGVSVDSSATLHWIHVRRAQGTLLQDKNDWAAICDEHEDIASAIQNGNCKLAAKLSEHHTELAHRRATPDLMKVDPLSTRFEHTKYRNHGQDC